MKQNPHVRTHRHSERGQVLAYLGIALIAFLGFAVIGVDVGRIAFTANEAQAVADAGALAACKSLSLGAPNPVGNAASVLAKDHVDGKVLAVSGSVSTPGNAGTNVGIELGNWDFAPGGNPTFTPGGNPENAARATSNALVNNLVAGAIGKPQTAIQRTAVAAYSGICQAQGVLPIALGDCYFQQFLDSSGNCSLLPKLTQAPDGTDNSCWTSLSPSAASANQVRGLLPTVCGGDGNPPLVHVDEIINIMNGQATSVLHALQGCLDAGLRDFLIPIIACGKCNQGGAVKGFAAIHINSLVSQGSNKGINLASLCKADLGGDGGGCSSFGAISVALLK
jgi:hypothetical protein